MGALCRPRPIPSGNGVTVAGLGLVLGLVLGLALGGLQPSGSSVRHAAIFIPPAAFFRLGIVSRQRQTLLAAGGAGWGCRCFWTLNWLRCAGATIRLRGTHTFMCGGGVPGDEWEATHTRTLTWLLTLPRSRPCGSRCFVVR